MTKQGKIWGDYTVDELILQFTQGDDKKYDALLIPFDIKATLAHIAMLHKIGQLTKLEYTNLKKALIGILQTVEAEGFSIPEIYEDGHSYLEACLIKQCGESGKKVHFLRSRNDQSLVAIRLYLLETSFFIDTIVKNIVMAIEQKATQHQGIIMPGHTHLQPAMPVNISTWLSSYKDALLDCTAALNTARNILDQNPLGSGAGFGFVGQSIQPDTHETTQLLHFAKTQQNPMYCGMSRGLFELHYLNPLGLVMTILSQLASDMLLYSMHEFQFLSLPDNFTTGSSIMPQKKNYDCLEIMRGNEAVYWGYVQQIRGIIAKKTNSYQRDLQLTKKSMFEAVKIASDTCMVAEHIVSNLQINEKIIKASLTPELYATAKANQLVSEGIPFRNAYLLTKKEFYTNEKN